MKKLPLGSQTFSKLIKGNYVYVDKTEYIYRLIQSDCYFFSRPRRFGKSILCSTLEELFKGNKELFKDLWIDKNTDYSWPVHPVIHIDFNRITIDSPEALYESLMRYLNGIAIEEGIEQLEMIHPGEMLYILTLKLQKKYNKNVVLIIDEYDRAILDNLDNEALVFKMQEALRRFYVFIKSFDKLLRFVFITGVSRFSKTSIFSGLNQIEDGSMDPQFAHLVGYTDQELGTFFSEHIESASANSEYNLDIFKKLIKEWYNGYRFWSNPSRKIILEELVRIYNPYSVLNIIKKSEFKDYWFESGTPTFLLKLLKSGKYSIKDLDLLQASQSELSTFDPDQLPLTTLLFQTGYLTIESYDDESRNFLLKYPNLEVQEGMSYQILVWLSKLKNAQINDYLKVLHESLQKYLLDQFIQKLKEFYVQIPNTIHIKQEKYFQTIFYTILKLIGVQIEVEVSTNIGRIDAVIKTEKYLYIIEFKLEKSATVALEQIESKKYVEQYLIDRRPITLIGITFSEKERNISDYSFKELKK
jgi:hypothetical protein